LATNSPKTRSESLHFLIFSILVRLCNGDLSGPPLPISRIDFLGANGEDGFFRGFAGVDVPYRTQESDMHLPNGFFTNLLIFHAFQLYFLIFVPFIFCIESPPTLLIVKDSNLFVIASEELDGLHESMASE
jgi:hypothetical protein